MTLLDIVHLRGWIGRAHTAKDVVTPRLLGEYAATLGGSARPDTIPLALHWCLARPATPAADLRADGRAARGGFLPPVPLPRRIWSGGDLRLYGRLQVNDAVERRSHIAEVAVEVSNTGPHCFVTVEHEVFGSRGRVLSERQYLVYRDAAGPEETRRLDAPANPPPPPPARWTREMVVDPVLLFRFSALTFDGHRIHYDRDYAMDIEHYPGLVVHGSLQATWLLEFAAEILERTPKTFTFRGVQPLFDLQKSRICAEPDNDGLKLWVLADSGKTMEARAR